jgi:hypothetical protein
LPGQGSRIYSFGGPASCDACLSDRPGENIHGVTVCKSRLAQGQKLSTKAKLIVAMLLIGGFVATLNIGLITYFGYDQSQTNVKSKESANEQAALTNEEVEKEIAAAATDEERAAAEEQLVSIEPVGWIDRNDWIVMTAWIALATYGMLAVAAIALWRRDESLPLTWGESLLYGMIAFGYLVIVFGFIPHYVIAIWDVQTGTWVSPFSVWPTEWIAGLWNESAVGWQWDWRAVRDIIVAGWYIVALLAMFVFWYWAQEFPKRQAQKQAQAEMSSPYGRPMLSAEK